MSMVDLSVLASVLVTLVGSILIGRNAEAVGGRFGLVDSPDELGGRKQHRRPTPLVGGMAICLAAVMAAFVTMGWQASASMASPGIPALAVFACGVIAMFLIGMADDRHTLSPRTRLAASILILLAILSSNPMFALTELHFTAGVTLPLGPMGVIFTLICLVGLLNAVNMADGKNGLVISLGLIWCAVLATQASALWYPVLAAMAVSLAVMRWFNMRGKLFLGDGGSYGLSAAFGLMAIHIHVGNPAGFGAEQVALLFAVPVFDTMRLMMIRSLRGTSPFIGDSDHLHHHLARRWGWPAGLYVYCALVSVPNLIAVLFPYWSIYVLAFSLLGYGLVIAMSHAPEPEVMPETQNNITRIGSGTRQTRKRPVSGQIDENAA